MADPLRSIVVELTPHQQQVERTARVANIPDDGESEHENDTMADYYNASLGYIEAFRLQDPFDF